MVSEDSQQNLAATDAAQAQKKQEPMGEIPDWVPGDLPDDKKKEFVEAVKKAWESDNTQFDFNGRTYKITEKLVGNQDKLDVDGNGKIEADDLAALRAGKKPVDEHHLENETETPGQTEYPGSDIKDVNSNGVIDGEDKAELPADEEDDKDLEESVRLKKSQDMLKVAHGAMTRDEFKKKWAHLKKPKNKLAGPGGLYKNLVKEGEENPTDKLTIDVPAMIRALEKSREDFKTDADIHNFVQDLLKKKDQEVTTNDLPGEPVNEAMSAIVTRKNADGSYDEVGMNNRRVLGGSHSSIMRQASDFAKGPHRVELFHGNRVGHGAPHKVVHVESTVVAEAKNLSADARAASAHAATQPSAATHRAAANAHEDAADHHEKKAEEIAQANHTGDDDDVVNNHTKAAKEHRNAAQTHRFKAYRLAKSQQNESVVAEKLDPKDDAGVWISDFVNSTDPKFDGKSKEERKQQALAAWYAARREAGINEEVMNEAAAADLGKQAHALSAAASTEKEHKAAANAHYKAAEAFRRHTTANAAKVGKKADDAHDAALKHEALGDKHLEKASKAKDSMKESTQMNKEVLNENIAGDHRAADLTTAANQASALAHSTAPEAGALAHHDAATKAHQHAADHYRVYAHHAGDPELRRAAEIHHKFHSDMAQHHTLKGVSLSMDDKPADNVNRYASGHMEEGTSADAKGGPEVMDAATKKMKDDADKNVKAEEAPYTNKADGSEEVTPADKPKPNPTPMSKLTAEQAIKSVAEAYAEMVNETAKLGMGDHGDKHIAVDYHVPHTSDPIRPKLEKRYGIKMHGKGEGQGGAISGPHHAVARYIHSTEKMAGDSDSEIKSAYPHVFDKSHNNYGKSDAAKN